MFERVGPTLICATYNHVGYMLSLMLLSTLYKNNTLLVMSFKEVCRSIICACVNCLNVLFSLLTAGNAEVSFGGNA